MGILQIGVRNGLEVTYGVEMSRKLIGDRFVVH